jgi:hypothetical protein
LYLTLLPTKNNSLPIYSYLIINSDLSLDNNLKVADMRNREPYSRCKRESVMRGRELHPGLSTGIFFIVTGVVLLAAFNDVLHWGSIGAYFTWPTILIYIGLLLLFNLKFIGGIIVMALGTWFLLDELDIALPLLVHDIFWPAIIIFLGLIFIISSFLRHNKNIN